MLVVLSAVDRVCVCVRQELADERLVELQMLVQCAGQVEAELQVLLKQLQDLQSSMCKTNQQKEEVKITIRIIRLQGVLTCDWRVTAAKIVQS